jgi:cyclophilin family peptidyl-prolyl cis-trans isomerase
MKNILHLFFAILIVSCSPKIFNAKWTEKQAPDHFKARFETTQGNFDIEAYRKWSPQGVDRLYQLIKNDFYTDIGIFRVIPKFVVQFGINSDSILNRSWKKYKISDEPVLQNNDSMAISFARGSINSRTTQIFINVKDNHRLDTLNYGGVKGFPVIAKLTNGMEIVHKFYSTKDNVPNQDSINKYGNAYLKRNYPDLDYINKAYILK